VQVLSRSFPPVSFLRAERRSSSSFFFLFRKKFWYRFSLTVLCRFSSLVGLSLALTSVSVHASETKREVKSPPPRMLLLLLVFLLHFFLVTPLRIRRTPLYLPNLTLLISLVKNAVSFPHFHFFVCPAIPLTIPYSLCHILLLSHLIPKPPGVD